MCVAAIAGAAGLSLVGALAPPTDGGAPYLALSKDYAREGRIVFEAHNAHSLDPPLIPSLFAYAFLEGGERDLALLNWIFGVLACGAAFVLGRRIEGRRCGLIAAAILATAPIFLDQTQTASRDLAFCGFTLAALACMAAWHDEQKTGWLFLCAFLAGVSCGIRLTGYLVCVLLALAVLSSAPRDARALTTVWFCVVAAIGAMPWFLRTAILAGNPFYSASAAFLGPYVGPKSFRTYGADSPQPWRGIGLRQFLMFPWNIIMRPQFYDGWSKSPGGLLLLLGIPGLIAGGKQAWRLAAFSVAGGACFFFVRQGAQGLLPFFAPMMVVAALAACRLKTLRHGIALLLLAMFAYGLAIDLALVQLTFPVVFGRESREGYLARRVERYPVLEWANRHIRPEDTVLTFDAWAYYLNGRAVPPGGAGDLENDAALLSLRDWPAGRQVEWFKTQGIKWIILPVTHIEETPGCSDAFLEMTNLWRLHRHYFKLAHTFTLPRGPAIDPERVEVYRVRYD
jgi:uncharacterized membrane protein YhaH (DUF805 family)